MRRARLLPLLAAAPLLLGINRCGIYMEYTETFQFVEPIERITLDIHRGSVQAIAYVRPAVMLKRHTSCFEPSLGPASAGVEGDALALSAYCKIEGECWYDHMLELPTGVALEFTMLEGYVEVGYIDQAITGEFEEGWFVGHVLAAPTVELTYGTGDVTLEFAAAPQRVDIEVGAGDVALTVPAGAYRCDFAAPGAPAITGVTCDDAAASALAVTITDGALTVTGA